MNEFKFQLSTFILVALLAFGGYYAFATLDKGITYTKEDLAVAPAESNQQEVLDEEASVINPQVTENLQEVSQEPTPEPSANNTTTQTSLSAEDTKTLGELEKLIKDNINMKQGSAGTRVGTVQKFLNRYFDKQTAIDNGYGPTTLERVRQFQKDQGLGADGLAGPATYQKMIEVMKKGL